MIKFYNRRNELAILANAKKASLTQSQMTIITGRRRIGKTRLILKATEKDKFIYLFVARKNESLLCREFIEEVSQKLDIPVIGKINSFSKLFEFLLIQAQSQSFTLAIDEFQEFFNINSSVYSDMQNMWDRYKHSSKMNLLLSGSIYSMMKKIFENTKEPLFGRANEKISLKPFNINVLKHILKDEYPAFKKEDILAFYIMTGGVAKYVEWFVQKKAFTLSKMLNELLRENSLLLDEGKNLLIEEFGKDYTTYFSILSLIASSKTSRSEIESILEKNVGGYLDRLEKDYGIIKVIKPFLSKPGGRVQKYVIEDNFLNFWFRFIYKNRSAIEIGNFDYIKKIVHRDFKTYSGRLLEKYFLEKLSLTNKYSQISSYWERNNKNEIDIVGVNETDKKLLLAEVKLNEEKFNKNILLEKSARLIKRFRDYDIQFRLFSLKDM